MLITFSRPGVSRFILIWDSDLTAAENRSMITATLRNAWGVSNLEGVGCICEQYHPTMRRWPAWVWAKWSWSQHVKVCPIPRNEYGETI